MYECPKCGGELRFDIASQKLICAYCKETTEYTDLKEESTAKESGNPEENEAYFFQCPNCGGRIMSTNLTAAEYCTFCGAFVELQREKGSFRRGDCIVPFKKTKEEVKELYAKTVAKKIYAPSAMRDPSFLDRFRGIYMPYWLYDVKLGPDIRFTAKTTEQDGNYEIRKSHALTCRTELSFDGVPYDASSSLRDSLGQAVTPFEPKDMIPYTPAVMLGFYADRPDTPAEAYKEEVKDAAAEVAFDRITEAAGFKDPEPDRPDDIHKLREQMKVRLERVRSAYLPVWFLTWRNKDRVAYSVVNGQTGEVCTELPVSFGRYLLFSLLTAVPLFAAIYFLLTITPYTILFFSGLLAVVMGQVYTRQLTAIARREMHADDKGYLETYPEAKQKVKDSTAGADSFLDLLLQFAGLVMKELPFVSAFVLVLLIRILVPAVSSDGSGRLISGIIVIALTVLVALRSSALSKEIEHRDAAGGVIGTVVAALTAAVITIVRPVSDLWYYGGSIFVLLAVLYSVFSLIRYYNLLVTDPVPHFFDRNVGDGTEKKYAAPPKKKKVRKADVAVPQPLVVFGICLLILAGAFILTEVTGFGSVPGGGRKTYENGSTGYFAYLSDEAELFSQEEEAKLEEEMIPITAYGNAAVVTARVIGQDTNEFAIDTYKSLFGGGVSGTIFLIDMGNRNLWICSDGEIYKTITKGYANIICDNVYRSATKGRYYQCASEALSQITVLLDGGKIARPMKLITSVLLALLLSCILNYWMVTMTLGVDVPGAAALAGGAAGAALVTDAASNVINTKRVYSPPSKSSGGGGGGFSGGGFSGGGGGGFSGGGGGHGF